jgi:hypothetical protein
VVKFVRETVRQGFRPTPSQLFGDRRFPRGQATRVGVRVGSERAETELDQSAKQQFWTPSIPRPRHSPGCGFVRTSQPLAQPSRGFVWRRSVERHERDRAPRNPNDARAPAVVGDGGHLDQVRVSADQFFEAMDGYAQG